MTPVGPTALMTAMLLVVAMPGATTSGQAPATTSPDCALLTDAEVEASLAVDVAAPIGDRYGCAWSATDVTLIVGTAPTVGLELVREAWPGGTEAAVGELAAFHAPDARQLWVAVGDTDLYLALRGVRDLDDATALTSLAILAVARMEDRTIEPTGDLKRLMPRRIAGERALVTVAKPGSGADLLAFFPGAEARLEEALEPFGTSVSALDGAMARASALMIVALRVKGLDATILLGPIAEWLVAAVPGVDVATRDVGGREVTVARTTGTPVHLYAGADILWVLIVPEAAIADIVATLP